MAHALTDAGFGASPRVRKIDTADLKAALAKGLDDFLAMPTHAIFLSLIYPVVGLIVVQAALDGSLVPLIFPIIAGFALVGPLAGIGLYELSRRREQGLDCTASRVVVGLLRSPALGAIALLGLGLMAVFSAWLAVAQCIYEVLFGPAAPPSVAAFLHDLAATPAGHMLIVVGNGVGFLFALLVLTMGVVSFPLLLDRPVGLVTAVTTSCRAVVANPAAMALWGIIVAGALVLGSIPLLFGLAVVLPVLGHATWHLYRAVIAPD
jgi:uncharacterized membrane protein